MKLYNMAKNMFTKKIKFKKSPPKSINRRTLLKVAGALSASSIISACGEGEQQEDAKTKICGAPAIQTGRRELKMVTAWPRNFPGLGTTAQAVADRIEILSQGKIKVHVYPAGELVGAMGIFDAVSQGKVDLYHGPDHYWQGRSLAYNFFGAVPFGMTAAEQNTWLRMEGGQQLWDKLSAEFNLKPFACGNTGVQMGGWYKKEINSIDDFKGLRVRIPGLAGEVLSRLGAATVTKPGGELYQALSTGNIDAADWIGPWNDLAFGFQNLVKNYYYPGSHEPSGLLTLGVNLPLWENMSAWEKAIFENATAAQNDYTLAEFNSNNSRALDVLVKKHDIKLRRFSDEIILKMAEISSEVILEAASSDMITSEIYQSFANSMEKSLRWSEVSDQAYAQARRLIFKK